ncbi:hypothetical protein BX600DRAFT_433528 [Xylariales sp. PMI_506]|nr:hypothetical protein BX600DRAFT_433528 [Xylariales sp. PMI_506]
MTAAKAGKYTYLGFDVAVAEKLSGSSTARLCHYRVRHTDLSGACAFTKRREGGAERAEGVEGERRTTEKVGASVGQLGFVGEMSLARAQHGDGDRSTGGDIGQRSSVLVVNVAEWLSIGQAPAAASSKPGHPRPAHTPQNPLQKSPNCWNGIRSAHVLSTSSVCNKQPMSARGAAEQDG